MLIYSDSLDIELEIWRRSFSHNINVSAASCKYIPRQNFYITNAVSLKSNSKCLRVFEVADLTSQLVISGRQLY